MTEDGRGGTAGRRPVLVWLPLAILGGWLGQVMLGGWWVGGVAGGIWGAGLGLAAVSCLTKDRWARPVRWTGAALLLIGGLLLFVVAAGAVAAVLGLYRASLPLSISPSHFVTPHRAIVS